MIICYVFIDMKINPFDAYWISRSSFPPTGITTFPASILLNALISSRSKNDIKGRKIQFAAWENVAPEKSGQNGHFKGEIKLPTKHVRK